ncbi:MAG: hypothetical protein GY757_21490, partial [bacterium]|nr:hypothetical protein [bacterium]
MYIINQMEAGSISYNQAIFAKLTGKLDREMLENSFRKLIERHETMRTVFRMVENNPVQKICETERVQFAIEDYKPGNSPVEMETGEDIPGQIGKIVNDFERPFDFSVAPMMRVGLIELQEEEHFIIVDMHHIITDAVSLGIFLDELGQLYQGKELLPLKLQYKDYSEWQVKMFESAALEKQERYWLKRFEGTIPLLDLPLDYPRPAVQDFAGAALHFELDEDLYCRIKELAVEADVTLFMILITAYTILLTLYTGKDDILI